eukprot:TRINITY_DN27892_c0_g1_i1.p1 TRINITY_DN27892_c0_g1~~TRINITY_DN27892_c0_g1_i1.p1  ORF type:complete len:101 (-),score=25.63 TRINITY_DN27892_c0_g1_i1:77-379(-)
MEFFILLVEFYSCLVLVFFFFKQKTAYEMLRSLVGSEMCIRDSCPMGLPQPKLMLRRKSRRRCHWTCRRRNRVCCTACLLYTSDAADEEDSGDLGGTCNT